MKCPIRIGEETVLLAYSSCKLDPPRAAALERHLGSCPECRDFVARQQAVWQALDAWQAPAAAADFDRRLYRRIEQEPERGWRQWVLRPALPVAAAACLAIAVGLSLDRPPAPQPVSPQVRNLEAEQVEHALDDMKMLSDFTRAARTDAGEL